MRILLKDPNPVFYRDTYTSVLAVHLLLVAKTWKQPGRTWSDAWVKKARHSPEKFYSPAKKNKMITFRVNR